MISKCEAILPPVQFPGSAAASSSVTPRPRFARYPVSARSSFVACRGCPGRMRSSRCNETALRSWSTRTSNSRQLQCSSKRGAAGIIRTHLLHIVSRPNIHHHTLQIRQFPGDVERARKGDEHLLAYSHTRQLPFVSLYASSVFAWPEHREEAALAFGRRRELADVAQAGFEFRLGLLELGVGGGEVIELLCFVRISYDTPMPPFRQREHDDL